jgi:hypothetical protein
MMDEYDFRDASLEIAKWQAEQLYKDDVIQTLEKGLALLLKKQERMYTPEEVIEIVTDCDGSRKQAKRAVLKPRT